MDRRYRLKSSSDFRRVRRTGKSYAHPLAVLIVAPNQGAQTRFGVTAARSLGGAVARNRAKRRLRAAIAQRLDHVRPGWDAIFIARGGLPAAGWGEVQAAMDSLLRRSGLLDRVERDIDRDRT
jgi:ribonuclease P protein component